MFMKLITNVMRDAEIGWLWQNACPKIRDTHSGFYFKNINFPIRILVLGYFRVLVLPSQDSAEALKHRNIGTPKHCVK